MLEVLPEDPALVFLLDSENERVAAGDCGVLCPGELCAEEGIVDGVVRVEVEEDVGGIGTGEEVGVIGVLNGGERIEVGEDLAVELILLGMKVVARNFEGLVNVKAIFEGEEPLVEDVKCRGFAEEENDEKRGKEKEENGKHVNLADHACVLDFERKRNEWMRMW